jgi:pimeloyl-ACP methyl ester carboxylesterase
MISKQPPAFLYLYFRQTLLVAVLTLFLFSCDRNKEEPQPVNRYLVSSETITEISKETLATQLTDLSPLLGGLAKNSVQVMRITYKTKNIDGKEITASGAVIIPVTSDPASMISVQHGTIMNDEEAPSYFSAQSRDASFGPLFGALGYILVYPDYIGYGASKEFPHPYEHRESLASASLDMIRAAKELINGQDNITWNNKLYLAGYSEGGYASMSLFKKIEDEAKNEVDLKAVSCGAGAYDKTAFMNYIINEPTEEIASNNRLYLWVLLSYDRIYGLNRPMSAYFKEPYATQISEKGLQTQLDVSFHSIFNEAFVQGINDGTDTEFINSVKDNNVFDWKPSSPLLLVHGDKDNTVFYFNSVNAHEAMKARGANVTLRTVEGGNHATSIETYLLQTYFFFENNK